MTSDLAGQTILVVDQPLIALDVAAVLRDAGAKVIIAHSCSDAITELNDAVPSAAILDSFVGEDGEHLAKRLKSAGVPIALYSGYSARVDKFDAYLTKPAHPDKILRMVRALLGRTAAAN